MQLYSALEREFQRPEFEQALARSQHELQQQRRQQQGGGADSTPVAGCSHAPAAGAAAGAADGLEVLSQDWWELKENGELRGAPVRAAFKSCSMGPAAAASAAAIQRENAYGLPAAVVHGAVSEQTGDYVLVERDDVVKALAAFIAEYIGALSAEGDRSQRP